MANQNNDFELIHNQVCAIHELWNLVLDLLEKDEVLNVLDECGSTAWTLIGDGLLDSVFLGLTRLITDNDSKRFGAKMRLERIVESELDPALKNQLTSKLTVMKPMVLAIKDHRDNRIAHWDHELAHGTKSLARVNFDDVRRVLEELRSFMNMVYQSRENSHFGYEYTRRVGDGRSIVSCLRDGLRMKRLRDDAWEGKRTDQEILDDLRSWHDAG